MKDVSLLSDEELNIRVAEICGWEIWNDFLGYRPGESEKTFKNTVQLPNYSHDLNAMHEAEMSQIAGNLDMEYRETLERVCGQYAVIYRATARQRAEAFVKVMETK